MSQTNSDPFGEAQQSTIDSSSYVSREGNRRPLLAWVYPIVVVRESAQFELSDIRGPSGISSHLSGMGSS